MIKRFDVTSNPVKLAEQLNRILNSIDADLRENKQAASAAVTTATSAMEGIAAIQGAPTSSAQPVIQPQEPLIEDISNVGNGNTDLIFVLAMVEDFIARRTPLPRTEMLTAAILAASVSTPTLHPFLTMGA